MRCPRVGILSFLVISLVHGSYAFTLGGVGRESDNELVPSSLTSRKSNDGEQVNRATVTGGNGLVDEYEQLLTFIERNIVADDDEEQSDDAPISNSLIASPSTAEQSDGSLVDSQAGETADDQRQKRSPDGERARGGADVDGVNPAAVDEEDYVDDEAEGEEDDDFSTGVYREKINWDDYRNEDGSSVLELIALNARYKTRMQSKQEDSPSEEQAKPEDEQDGTAEVAEAEYLYRQSDNDYVEHGDDHLYTWANERLLNPDNLPLVPEEEREAFPP